MSKLTTEPKRILCFGDSNTWGFSPKDGSRLPKRWTRMLELDNAEIIEEGLNSRTAFSKDEYAPERVGIHAFKMLLQSHKPLDAVVVMLGTNDLKGQYHNSARNIANGLREYARLFANPTLFEGFKQPKLLIVSPILCGENLPELEGEAGMFNRRSVEQSRLLSLELENALEPYDVEFLDAARYAKASKIDGLHMEEEEHAKLAKAIREKLQEMLGENE